MLQNLLLRHCFLLGPPPLHKSTLTHIYNILTLLLFVCRDFYKQSVVQSEVWKLYVHPTWFICNQDSIVNVFRKIKLGFNTVHVFGLYTRLNDLMNRCYFFHTLHVSNFTAFCLTIDKISRPKFKTFQNKSSQEVIMWILYLPIFIDIECIVCSERTKPVSTLPRAIYDNNKLAMCEADRMNDVDVNGSSR